MILYIFALFQTPLYNVYISKLVSLVACMLCIRHFSFTIHVFSFLSLFYSQQFCRCSTVAVGCISVHWNIHFVCIPMSLYTLVRVMYVYTLCQSVIVCMCPLIHVLYMMNIHAMIPKHYVIHHFFLLLLFFLPTLSLSLLVLLFCSSVRIA